MFLGRRFFILGFAVISWFWFFQDRSWTEWDIVMAIIWYGALLYGFIFPARGRWGGSGGNGGGGGGGNGG